MNLEDQATPENLTKPVIAECRRKICLDSRAPHAHINKRRTIEVPRATTSGPAHRAPPVAAERRTMLHPPRSRRDQLPLIV